MKRRRLVLGQSECSDGASLDASVRAGGVRGRRRVAARQRELPEVVVETLE